jgi:hypothetical protein
MSTYMLLNRKNSKPERRKPVYAGRGEGLEDKGKCLCCANYSSDHWNSMNSHILLGGLQQEPANVLPG